MQCPLHVRKLAHVQLLRRRKGITSLKSTPPSLSPSATQQLRREDPPEAPVESALLSAEMLALAGLSLEAAALLRPRTGVPVSKSPRVFPRPLSLEAPASERRSFEAGSEAAGLGRKGKRQIIEKGRVRQHGAAGSPEVEDLDINLKRRASAQASFRECQGRSGEICTVVLSSRLLLIIRGDGFCADFEFLHAKAFPAFVRREHSEHVNVVACCLTD